MMPSRCSAFIGVDAQTTLVLLGHGMSSKKAEYGLEDEVLKRAVMILPLYTVVALLTSMAFRYWDGRCIVAGVVGYVARKKKGCVLLL